MSDLPKPSMASNSLYRRDPFAWSKEQAEALRLRDLEGIDWSNVIEEIESVGQAQNQNWVSHCARAIEHMLAIEHCKAATSRNLRHWVKEIRSSRIGMASAIRRNQGLQWEYAEMLVDAWADGRAYAVDRLAEYSTEAAGADDDWRFRRVIREKLPADCPYLVEHVAAYDPKRDKDPKDEVLPPGVAIVLNRALGRDYAIPSGAEQPPKLNRIDTGQAGRHLRM